MTRTQSGIHATPAKVLFVGADAETRYKCAENADLAPLFADTARDGNEAFAKAILWIPDVVVASACLGGIDGFDLCRCLRRNPTTRHTGVILVAPYVTREMASAARESHCDAFVTDPCPFDILERIIARVLRERRSPAAECG